MQNLIMIETTGALNEPRKAIAFAMSGDIEIGLFESPSTSGFVLIAGAFEDGNRLIICEEYITGEADAFKTFAAFIQSEYAGAELKIA